MKEKYLKLLDSFCSEKKESPFAEPYYDGKWVCATNTRSMIRVHPDALPAMDVGGVDVRPKECPLNDPLRLPLDEVVRALATCDLEDEEVEVRPAIYCEECGGIGEVEWEYKHHTLMADCPECAGSGRLADAIKRKTGRKIPHPGVDTISINGVAVDAFDMCRVIEVSCELNEKEVLITSLGEDCAVTFRINDVCEVLLAPYPSRRDVTYAINL